MKIISFNIRGLANRVKWRALRSLVAKEQIDMLLLQETKLQNIDNRLCCQIWGDADFDWKMMPSTNTAGGLLCIWRCKSFVLSDVVTNSGFIGLIGKWEARDELVVVVNVYSPCSLVGKRQLWADLVTWKAT